MVDKTTELLSIFIIDIYAYGAVSSYYHIVVKVDKEKGTHLVLSVSV